MPGPRPGMTALSIVFAFHFHRLPADITPAKSIRPVDAVDRVVSPPLRLGHRLARRADVEHAAAIGEDLSVLCHRARVKNLDALNFGGVIEPFDARTSGVFAGIA